MILPENLYRCKKIAHRQAQNLKKNIQEGWKNPADPPVNFPSGYLLLGFSPQKV